MVQEWKIKKVKELTEEIDASPVVGMLDLHGLGAAQLQKIRTDTRDSAKIIVTKKGIIKRAIDSSKKENIKDLEKYEPHIPALMLSKDNAFKLYRKVESSKTEAYAKAGNIAPRDITIPAGETNLPPGPVISDLQSAGVKAMIQGDKIAIREDSPLVKEGEAISAIKANVMMKLGIKPMEVSLNMMGAHEKDIIFDKSTLAVNTEEYLANIRTAYTQAFNLAYNADIFIKEIMPQKLREAHTSAMNLAINTEIASNDTIAPIIQKANSEMQSLASQLPEGARGSATAAQPQASPAPAPAGEAEAAPKQEKKEEKKEEKAKTDEEAAEGLGALFG